MLELTLEDLGWNAGFEMAFRPFRKNGWMPARLIRDHKISYGALFEGGEERDVILSGKVYHEARSDAELPTVGDWVAVEFSLAMGDAVIRARLGRQSCFSRKAPGKSTEEQVLAANVDTVFVVTDAGIDFNPRRLERYFALIARSGARPVVLLNRSDLYSDAINEEAARAVAGLNGDACVHVTSALNQEGVRVVRSYLKPGHTITLAGSSGVGKSSIINQLLGFDYQETGAINEVSGKGRHTTSARELFVLPGGGILVDNPGIREVQMWTDETTLRDQFADIDLLARQCRFHDCRHGTDHGCAIRAAVESGGLDSQRLEGFLRLDDEILELKKRRKKRQMTLERRHKRELRKIIRNRADQEQARRESRPTTGTKVEDFGD